MSFFTLIILAVVVLLIPTAYAGKIGAPYAPTKLRAIKKAFDFIEIDSDDVVVDLGAGDGKVLVEAAARGARAHGYELSPLLWAVAYVRTWGKKGVSVTYKNFYKASLAEATVIFAFLMPQNMSRVLALVQSQPLTKGTYFIAYAFPFPNLSPLHVIREPDCAAMYIYDLQELTKQPDKRMTKTT